MQHNILCNSYGRTVVLTIDEERIGTFTSENKEERQKIKLEAAKIITKIENCKSERSYKTHINSLKKLFQVKEEAKKQDKATEKAVARKNKKTVKKSVGKAKEKSSRVKDLLSEISNLNTEDLDELTKSIPQLQKKQKSVPKTSSRSGTRRRGEY